MVLKTCEQTDRHDNNNTLHHSRRGGGIVMTGWN